MTAPDPSSGVTMALVSERLNQVEARLETLENLARTSNELLGKLVTIEEARVKLDERRDLREEETAKLDREERAASTHWVRSMIERALWPVMAAAGIGGGVYGWVSAPAQPAEQHPESAPHLPPSDVHKDRPTP